MFSPASSVRLALTASGLLFTVCLTIIAWRSFGARAIPPANSVDFTLPALDGRPVTLYSMRGKVVVLVFTSARSPLAAGYARRLDRFSRRYARQGHVELLAIETTIPGARAPSMEELRVHDRLSARPCLTLVDADGAVGRRMAVTRTPTVYVIDELGDVRYHGAFDDNPDEELVTSHFLEDAVASLLQSRVR